jgi:hypothetical protein
MLKRVVIAGAMDSGKPTADYNYLWQMTLFIEILHRGCWRKLFDISQQFP